MRIAHGHGHGLVTQQLAHRGKWDASHDQPRGEGMAQVMEVEINQARPFGGVLERVADITERPPILGWLLVGLPCGGISTHIL